MTNNSALTDTRTRNTVGLRPFPPGVSGNPSGRPKLQSLDTYIRAHLDPAEWFRNVWGVATNEKHRDMVRANELLANRAWGAPRQSLALSRDEDDPGLAAMRQLIAAIHGGENISSDVIEADATVVDALPTATD